MRELHGMKVAAFEADEWGAQKELLQNVVSWLHEPGKNRNLESIQVQADLESTSLIVVYSESPEDVDLSGRLDPSLFNDEDL